MKSTTFVKPYRIFINKKYSHSIKINICNIIKIQSIIRGYLVRKSNMYCKDVITRKDVYTLLNNYKLFDSSVMKIKTKLQKCKSKKNVRRPNFPSEISENLVKYILAQTHKITGRWCIDQGDLKILTKKVEVKAFSGNCQLLSFGPSESWHILCILDCTDYINDVYKCYIINEPNDSTTFGSIQVNKSQTFENQCYQKRRPRITFKQLKDQLGTKCRLIFNGNITHFF
jgi:hypothetical protein